MPMRLPRVRVRLWWLMVAVAVVAVALWAQEMRRNSISYHELAETYAWRARLASEAARVFEGTIRQREERSRRLRADAAEIEERAMAASGESRSDLQQIRDDRLRLAQSIDRIASGESTQVRWLHARAAWCLSVMRKYEHLARYPWLSEEPDPPEPPRPPAGPRTSLRLARQGRRMGAGLLSPVPPDDMLRAVGHRRDAVDDDGGPQEVQPPAVRTRGVDGQVDRDAEEAQTCEDEGVPCPPGRRRRVPCTALATDPVPHVCDDGIGIPGCVAVVAA